MGDRDADGTLKTEGSGFTIDGEEIPAAELPPITREMTADEKEFI